MLSLVEQVIAARVPRKNAVARQDEMYEKDRELLDWMVKQARNVPFKEIMDAFGMSECTARERLGRLHANRQVFKFKFANKVWWSVTKSELERRKK